MLTGERSSPLVVWSGGMRRQLRRVIDDHARSAPITHDMLRTLGAFKYDEVAEEMVVEDVYVRLFVEVLISPVPSPPHPPEPFLCLDCVYCS